MKFLIVILFLSVTFPLFSQERNIAVPYTLADRDRLIRNEQKIDALRTEMNVQFESVDSHFKSLEKEMNIRFDAVNKRIDDLQQQMGFMTTLLMFVLGAIMSLIGFVIYDRRTAIKPVQRKQNALEDALVDYSKKHPELRDILKNAGIL